MKRLIGPAVVLLLLIGGGAGAVYWFFYRDAGPHELLLYGNVDLREVNLAFNENERIAEVLVHEGDQVKRGQLVSVVDTSRLGPQTQHARANLELARVDVANAQRLYDRLVELNKNSQGRGVSKQDLDNAEAALAASVARQHANEAQLTLLEQQLADAKLVAPVDAVVRSRLLEPGEMASPQKPVLALSIIDPKWVRAYVSEPDLGRIKPGEAASISVDSFPEKRFSGWIGFISPVAEFTPKSVETSELRTSLVYEVRVFVKDPANVLRLGMPATVHLSLVSSAPAP